MIHPHRAAGASGSGSWRHPRPRRARRALALTLLALAAAIPPARAQERGVYRVGPKDLVDIRVFEVPELNVQRRVSENGKVNLPLIGDIDAQGKTVNELEAYLKRLLEETYVQRASVAVEVLEYRSRPISVIGAVKNPGDLAFPGRWTLIEAITAAGGLADNHGDIIYVLRRADNGLSDQVAIPVKDLMVYAVPEVNVPIFANDLINVPSAVEVTIYCLGEVAQPGALSFKNTERITVLAAVARAGGLTDRAADKVLIKRDTPRGEQEIEVDYKRIIAGKEPDFKLRDGDVMVVKESFF